MLEYLFLISNFQLHSPASHFQLLTSIYTMYTYCPQCGGKLITQDPQVYICSECSFHFYQNPKPTNGLIAENEQGEILLVKRAFEPGKGLWDIPGGFIDSGETLEQSMQREIKEELGVVVKNLQYFNSYPDLYTYQDVTVSTLVFMMIGTVDPAALKAADDVSEVKFFPKDNLPWDQMAFKSMQQTLKDYLTIS